MAQSPSSDRLEQYSRILILAGPAKARLYLSPILPEEEGLFETIDALWRNMQRLAPDDEFREQLRQQLIEEARRNMVRQHLGLSKSQRRFRPPWLASAAALGAAATLAGAYAYWRWNSSRQAA